ncbi:unnamed protein product [Cyclocybe aegerita]|uniref:Uncharacterized protein n=1 Tax=Cyclocybe aegerita TaxID=1973307 RepID=A0A8S0XJY9_CYCAE|nr:unnamed protein product [Cyclocybe aegerita]
MATGGGKGRGAEARGAGKGRGVGQRSRGGAKGRAECEGRRGADEGREGRGGRREGEAEDGRRERGARAEVKSALTLLVVPSSSSCRHPHRAALLIVPSSLSCRPPHRAVVLVVPLPPPFVARCRSSIVFHRPLSFVAVVMRYSSVSIFVPLQGEVCRVRAQAMRGGRWWGA